MNYLILKNVDINSKDKNGLTPLHYSMINNNEIVAQRLLKEDHILINARNYNLTVNKPMGLFLKFRQSLFSRLESIILQYLT